MARERTVRPGQRWQPDLGRRTSRPVAGRLRWRRPRLGLPGWTARWRQLVLLAIAVVAIGTGGWWVYRSPLLSIREVTVEGVETLSPEMVNALAGLEGQSLLQPDFEGARQRLLALPLVKDVQISRDWPSGAHITIVERTPWGVWQVGGMRFVIDDEGVVLDVPAPAGAPVIVQYGAFQPLVAGDRVDAGAVAVARQLAPTARRTLGRSLVALEFSQASGLTAVLATGPDDPGLRAVFGDAQGYDFKLATLYTLLRQADQEGRTLTRVDLRFGDRVAVQ
ncbi:MAG: FtsQ-type POTRA domain-containing protein [Chloroflexi bacterium]|nr:FtsQ-type POTRA domain-containing protein [Chloroflexota bacterium]